MRDNTKIILKVLGVTIGKPRRIDRRHRRRPVKWTMATFTQEAVKAEMAKSGMSIAALPHVMAVMLRHVEAIDKYSGITITENTFPGDDELMHNFELVREAYDDWEEWVKTGDSVLTWKLPERPLNFTKFLQYVSPADSRI